MSQQELCQHPDWQIHSMTPEILHQCRECGLIFTDQEFEPHKVILCQHRWMQIMDPDAPFSGKLSCCNCGITLDDFDVMMMLSNYDYLPDLKITKWIH